MLPQASHDELARQAFVQSFKIHLANEVSPGNRVVYEKRVLPAFEERNKRSFRDRHEVRKAMNRDAYHQLWSALQRTSQEMMWDAVSTSVDRQAEQLAARARQCDGAPAGSLRLDPDLPLPRYHAAVDIHCQPGGYHTELRADDVAAGAIYDRAVYIYTMGRAGALNDDMGNSVVLRLQRDYPDFRPRRILDMGCTVGHSTLPYVDAWPGAEVHGIDVAAPVLRYAHGRAESLGRRVHFSQQNAEHTDFEDESFDLVVSHILFHETSARALKNIVRECHRLLRPGGLMAHLEVPPYAGMDLYDQHMLDWDTYNNNEPFWGASHEISYEKPGTEAGFAAENLVQTLTPSALVDARKRTGVFQGGDFAGAGQWFLYLGRK